MKSQVIKGQKGVQKASNAVSSHGIVARVPYNVPWDIRTKLKGLFADQEFGWVRLLRFAFSCVLAQAAKRGVVVGYSL